ncbi:MAG: hypothetical protein QW348_04765 [Ignisphaera sp.]
MRTKEIDLRGVPSSCNSHPIAVLVNSLRSISREEVEEIRIIFNASDIPVNLLRFFLSREGFTVVELVYFDKNAVVAIARKHGR